MMGAGGSAYTAIHRDAQASRISPHTSGIFTVGLGFWPGRNWGIRLQAAHMPTRFEEIRPGVLMTLDGSDRYSKLSIRSYLATANFRMLTIQNRVMPYGIIGGGVVEYRPERDEHPIPLVASDDFAEGVRREPAGVVGVGARVQTRSNGWALNFELTDQLSRSPIGHSDGNSVRVANAASFIVGLSWTLYSH
ncbi:MAG TPA: hypothetical protein VM100_13080 [Longimicrobiales bacterium]|nr:hypothetical protein [Longimicrobiales bacterium]